MLIDIPSPLGAIYVLTLWFFSLVILGLYKTFVAQVALLLGEHTYR